MLNASRGSGFIYGRRKVAIDDKNTLLGGVLAKLNSEDCLAKIRNLSSNSDINYANMQVTRFSPGQFLARHNDVVDAESRRVAYVINHSPKWHPDWGGILQFFDQEGETTESWCPKFNALSLFDVKNVHSVSYVTPFAKTSRYSITGWFGKR